MPRRITFVDALPRNEGGKVLKAQLVPGDRRRGAAHDGRDSPRSRSSRSGACRRLTLNRPEHHNPLTPRCIREILRAVEEAEADAGDAWSIIRSTGRSFSSGYGFVAEDVEPGDFAPHDAHRR